MVKIKMTTSILKWTSPVGKLSRNNHSSLAANSNLGGSNLASAAGHHNQAAKRWIHDDALLINGHVAYQVKFLGNVEVDQPKGLEIVKESIKKLEFQEHLKRSEGEKIKRIELTISIDGVAIREPKTKTNIHQFPLHRISYCADDKSERKYLSFITKVQEGSDRHECFVFVSDKLSEEITLTIGQAFELAYRKFLDASGRDFDTKKELVQARKKIQELERKVTELEQQLQSHQPLSSSAQTTMQPASTRSITTPTTTTTAAATTTSSNSKAIHQQHLQTPPVSPTTTTQTIDLSLATTRLQSLIDLP